MKQMRLIIIMMLASLAVAGTWNSIPAVSSTVHAVLDPTLGKLLGFNQLLGMLLITAFLSLVTTLLQKYTIDKDTMKDIKAQQKELKEQQKEHKNDPEKAKELMAKQMELMGKSFPIMMRPAAFTMLPFILLFRWFFDLYNEGGLFEGTIFLGFMSWFWFYLLSSIIFSQIFRKVFKTL
jgi:uncharacterized membrane protein (DUF106 family)